jgi:TolA-binding protein
MRLKKIAILAFLAMMTAVVCPTNAAASETGVANPADPYVATKAQFDSGFRKLYELDFNGARSDFVACQKEQPNDPLGKAAEAASYLFEELNAKGVFTSAFFLDDSKLLGGVDGRPADNRNDAFTNSNNAAREIATQMLRSNPHDPRGLLVLTITDGMEADYDGLIIKKQLASVHLIRQAETEAAILLATDPSAQDAYLALGASNYIVGSMSGFKRTFLWFDNVHGDREKGLHQLEMAAQNGHYLAPFAKILLALALQREHQTERARALLADLTAEFPANPLFAHELSLVDQNATAKR